LSDIHHQGGPPFPSKMAIPPPQSPLKYGEHEEGQPEERAYTTRVFSCLNGSPSEKYPMSKSISTRATPLLGSLDDFKMSHSRTHPLHNNVVLEP
jgi:hypothetical protein